jgi:hypothetical protein
MSDTDLIAERRADDWISIVREWWVPPVLIASALIAQRAVLDSRYSVGGHAAEHLAGASAPFMAGAVVCILLWATPRACREVDLLASACAWIATTLLVMVGNLRVVDDLVAAGYSHTPTSAVPDVADHSLANASVWYATAAAVFLVLAWYRRRHVGNRATVGALVTTVIIPPWIIPGAGVIVVTLVRVIERARDRRTRCRKCPDRATID